MIILACWIWALGLQVVLTEIFRAFGKFFLTMLSSTVLVSLVNLLILVGFNFINKALDFSQVIFLVAFNTVMITLISLLVVRTICINFDNENSTVFGKSTSDLAKQIIKESTPSFINKLGLYFTVLADLWLVAMFFDKDIVADYGVATKLAAVLAIFLSIANGFVPTFIGRLKNEENIAVERFLRLSATLVALPTFILFGFLYFKSVLVIELVFGVEYISAASFLSILILAQMINVMVGSCSYTLVMDGMNSELMKISILTGIAAIALAFIFISLGFGSLAIAWCFTITAIARHLSVYIAARKYCNINTAIYLNPFIFVKNLKLILQN